MRGCLIQNWTEAANNCKELESDIDFTFISEMVGEVVVPPSKKLEDLIRLAELCVDLLRQNEEFYAEVRAG